MWIFRVRYFGIIEVSLFCSDYRANVKWLFVFFFIVLRFFFFAFVCLLFLPCHFCTVCTSVYDMPHVSPIFGLAIYFSNKVERETVDDLRCSPARQFVHPTHQTLPNMSQLPVLRNRVILESLKYISSSRFLFFIYYVLIFVFIYFSLFCSFVDCCIFDDFFSLFIFKEMRNATMYWGKLLSSCNQEIWWKSRNL